MAAPRPNSSLPDGDNRTRVQGDPPQTQEFSADATSPTFGTFPPGGVPEFPFLSAPQAADELGRLGDYRVLKKLGEGGMGFVFRGEDPALKRFVALKVMRPEVAAKPQAADRFLREGRAAAGLKSDHIITVYGVGTANGVPYLAMEFLEGLPLDEWIKAQKKAVPLQHALRVVRDTLRGLAVAHEKGLIHRDIKPANLWIEKGTSRIKILDFGLTRGNDGDVQLTQEGAVVGTPAFMAPEQAGGKPVDPRADLFSVGVVFYTLLAGKNPFTRDSLMATLGAVGFETQPPVTTARPDVPAEYSAFLDRLLTKDPAGRPANAKTALQELAAIEKKLADGTKTLATSQPLVAIPIPDAAPPVWGELADDDAPTVRLPKPAAAGPKKPTNKKLLLGGGLFAFLVVLGGIIIVITNKDGSKTTVEVPDGSKVEVKDGGKTVATVGPRKAAAKKPVMDADRKAAEFVLANGGIVIIGDRRYEPKDAAELPAEPFKCLSIYLPARELTDAEAQLLLTPDGLKTLSFNYPLTEQNFAKLVKLPAAQSIETLEANAVELTDAGLKHFRTFPRLRYLSLGNFRTTGAGFKEWAGWELEALLLRLQAGFVEDNLKLLKDLPKLANVNLTGGPVTDAGVRHLAGLTGLREVNLYSTKVTDAGVAALEKLPTLNYLRVQFDADTTLTRECLKSVGRMKSLVCAVLDPPVGDADVQPLLGLDNLSELVLNGKNTELTDAGLTALAGLKKLSFLSMQNSRVTADGVRKFRAARPDVKLGGQLLALADPDRAAALFVIGRGGSLDINGHGNIAEVAKLPAEPFTIWNVYLSAPREPITDADLDQFQDLKDLQFLNARGPITDAGLAKLAAFPKMASLKHLIVDSPDLTDAALAAAPKFAALVRFQLSSPKVTGAGLAHLKGSNVESLHLCNATLADAELAKLKDVPKLTWLDLTQTPITDAGLKHVGGLKQLTTLTLYGVRTVTDAGAKHLEGLTELVTLHANAVPFGDAGFASLAKLPKLKSLQGPEMANVTDAGMKALAKAPSLEFAALAGTPLTDAGLAALAACKTLKQVQVGGTKVTAAGVAAFRKARPDVAVESDFGSFAAADPDRRAAEFVLNNGGVLHAADTHVADAMQLPKAPFKISIINLTQGRTPQTDADLDQFRDLTDVVQLALKGPITDAGLKKLTTFPFAKKLSLIDLLGTQVTDDGLKALRDFPELTTLSAREAKDLTGTGLAHLKDSKVSFVNLQASGLTDAGLAALAAARPELPHLTILATGVTDEGMKHLGRIKLTGTLQMQQCTNVTDAGFRHLEGLTALELFEYANFCPRITPASLASVGKMTGLKHLGTQFEAPVTDADLKPLLEMKNLTTLVFNGNTTVTDDGLAALGKLPALKALTLLGDKVTPAGAKAFHKARPDVKLTTNYGTIEAVAAAPAADPDRTAAAWVIERGGYVRVLGQSQDIKAAADLPPGRFTLTFVHLSDRQVSDADPQRLQPLDGLHVLVLGGTQVTDAGLVTIKEFKTLTRLDLSRLPLTDDGMKHLKELKALRVLSLYGVPLTDAGLEHLKELRYLRTLNVGGTKVTAESARAFHQALPDCQVEYTGGVVGRPFVPRRSESAAENLLPLADLGILTAGATAETKLKAGSPLPAGTFRIVSVRVAAPDRLPKTFADDVLLPAVSPLARLTTLVDAESKIDMGKADPARWAALESWEGIQQFELAVPLTDAWIDTFRQFPNLTAIHVNNAKAVPVGTVKRLAELKSLRTLIVRDLEGQDRWHAVTALPLKKVALGYSSGLDRAACERIAAMPELDTLYFNRMALTPETLAAIGTSRSIRWVMIKQCTIPTTGFDDFARLPTLYSLTIKVSEFDDTRLAQLAGSQSLKYLFVKETAVTEAGVKALAAKLPGCTIEWAGGRVAARK